MIFILKDVLHKVSVKYVKALLPKTKKAYYLKAVHQPKLDIHGIAAKAAAYNITTNPKVIEEGLTAAMELIYYLVADGFIIKTPLFNLKMRIPGEYNGTETSLPKGTFPEARLQTNSAFRKYLKDKVEVCFEGIDDSSGIIAEAADEATGLIDEVMTRGNLLTITGTGIKIAGNDEHKDSIGVFFIPETGAYVKANVIAVNTNKTLKVLVPQELSAGTSYRLVVETMSSVKGNGYLIKKARTLRSDFTLVAA